MGRIESAGATLIAISADAPADRDALVKKLGLSYPVLSDVDLALAAAFGVRQEGKEAPLPATFVLAADGEVLWSSVGTSIVNRPSLDETLRHLP